MRLSSRLALAALLHLTQTMGAAPGTGAPVLMPPFMVEEQKGDGIEWIYGDGGDVRVLSGCGTDQTAGFLQQITTQRSEIGRFIPEEFLLHENLPETLVLFPKSRKQAMGPCIKTWTPG